MNALRRILATAALVAAFFSIPASAQKVETDYDHSVSFSRYHTYSWGRVHASDPLFESRIREAVDHALQAKGWQQVPADGDVLLTAVAIQKSQPEYITLLRRIGWGLEMARVGHRYGYNNGGKDPGRHLSRRHLRLLLQEPYMAW